MRRLLRAVILGVALAAGALCGVAAYGWWRLGASLPSLDGRVEVAGLSGPVTIARDALGIPTITGSSRADVAAGLGFAHAQDRFFQMDLQRRQPAGELSALVGARAIEVDRRIRVHRFRDVARRAVARADPEWRAVLEAYARGVNHGLASLGASPFEYSLLRATPEPWTPEDSVLTVLAMFDRLQGRQMEFEQANEQLRDALPPALFAFLARPGSAWDAPVDDQRPVRPPLPGPDTANLRARAPGRVPPRAAAEPPCALAVLNYCLAWTGDLAASIGSNNWAVDAGRSAAGRALVANDMHLDINVPVLWYRAAMVVPDPADPLRPLRLHGVTLPGVAPLVVGSTGYVAWSFTNSNGDWSDLVRIEPDPHDASRYLTPEGPRPFDDIEETIAVKDGPPQSLVVRQTVWGPVVWRDRHGRLYAQRWVAHDPDVLATDLTRVERARTVEELLVAVNGLGLPHQNVVVADRGGRIAWTVGGAIPRRRGWDGFTPVSWADGSSGWDGYLPFADVPRMVDPPDGRLWTANAPVVGGDRLALIGDGGYLDGIRARIIRDRLRGIPRATALDMLAVQLDDSALFLERWRALVLEVLRSDAAATPATVAPRRAEFRSVVETTWTGRASPDSAAYRLVRTFRLHAVRRVLSFLTSPAAAVDPSFTYTRTTRGEGPVWEVLAARPRHLLDPAFPSWDALLVAAVDDAIEELDAGGRQPLAARTWGQANRAQFAHPLAPAVPLFGRWLVMPADPLVGDVYAPRAQSPRTGPSERLVVSPGFEEDGLLHIPTGQSAHPRSPHFRDMHAAWVAGLPVPLLPGPARHTLVLTRPR